MLRKFCVSLALLCAMSACNSGSLGDALDLADGIARKDIDASKLGVNAFANDARFGTISQQFREVHDTLRLNYVRILFAWNDQVQPTPGAQPNFSFYDDVLAGIPSGVDALVVITGVPSWVSNSANWVEGNPRTTFVESWVRKVVQRYRNNPRIVGWEIWNEPNMVADPDTTTLDIGVNPVNYVELLARAYSVAKSIAPSKLVLNGATTAINQNYSETLEYNEQMRDAGAQQFLDKWAIHYYGKQYENVQRSGGVKDFLNGLTRGVWITESGAQGVNDQLAYGEQAWPFLLDEIPGIERIYIYQFTEATPSDVTYGLKNLDSSFPVSDLYIWLRDRA
jgi:hypothetical protein